MLARKCRRDGLRAGTVRESPAHGLSLPPLSPQIPHCGVWLNTWMQCSAALVHITFGDKRRKWGPWRSALQLKVPQMSHDSGKVLDQKRVEIETLKFRHRYMHPIMLGSQQPLGIL